MDAGGGPRRAGLARTGRPAWTGLVAAAAFVPIGLLAPVGGALADRLDRRRWLIVTTLAEMAFATVLAVLAAPRPARIALVGLAFCGGAAGSIGFPAYQAMVPDLVPPEDLLAAVSMSSAQFNLGRVIGPALAGLVLLTHDYALVFGVNAASFGAVVVALLFVRLPPPLVAGRRPLDHPARIVDGARTAFAEPGCRAAIGLIAVVALLASPFIALVPAMAGVVFATRSPSPGHLRPDHRPGSGGGRRCCPVAVGGAAGRSPDDDADRRLFCSPFAGRLGLAPPPWWSPRSASSPWAPGTSPCCPGSTRWCSSGPRPPPGDVC